MSLYGLHNLPYGVFSVDGGRRRIGVRVHDDVLDLDAAETAGLIDAGGALRTPTLNALMAQGRPAWAAVRSRVRELAAAGDGTLVPLAADFNEDGNLDIAVTSMGASNVKVPSASWVMKYCMSIPRGR